jgi:hypothetical protein
MSCQTVFSVHEIQPYIRDMDPLRIDYERGGVEVVNGRSYLSG